MLDRSHRLRRRSEFTTTVRGGRRAARSTLVVHLLRAPERSDTPADPPRAGFIVSRAVGGAVERNRVRRRLRHLVRPHLTVLPAGTSLVIRALPAAERATTDRLAADLAAALADAERPSRRSGR